MITLRRLLGLPVLALAFGAGCGDDPPPTQIAGTALPAIELVAGGLALPVFVTSPPGDSSRLFVVLQRGPIRIIRNDTLLPDPFLDLTGLVATGGEQGVLGLAFDPRYATNGRFFVHFTDLAGDTRVVRYTVSPDPDVASPNGADTILALDQPFANHNGGMIVFGPDGHLYIGLGDGGSGGDPQNNAQTLTTLLGKILRIDVSGASGYTIPPDNPFAHSTSARPEIWALGLRNPWRFSFDRLTGEMYIGDVGQAAAEEIDIQPAGAGGRNYGWRVMEGFGCRVAGCTGGGFTPPVHAYPHTDGCSVTGGYVYRAGDLPALEGHYLYADFCDGWIKSFRWTGSRIAEHDDWSLRLAPGGTVSSFGEDARGRVYIVSHGASGSVRRIIPDPALP